MKSGSNRVNNLASNKFQQTETPFIMIKGCVLQARQLQELYRSKPISDKLYAAELYGDQITSLAIHCAQQSLLFISASQKNITAVHTCCMSAT